MSILSSTHTGMSFIGVSHNDLIKRNYSLETIGKFAIYRKGKNYLWARCKMDAEHKVISPEKNPDNPLELYFTMVYKGLSSGDARIENFEHLDIVEKYFKAERQKTKVKYKNRLWQIQTEQRKKAKTI